MTDPSTAEVPPGRVVRVAGPVVVAIDLPSTRLYNVVRVGRRFLVGEVIRLHGEEVVIQVYEDTSGLQVGSTVIDTGAPLRVELGPGLLANIFDGVQRPLPALATVDGTPNAQPFIRRGQHLPALDRDRTWTFSPVVAVGDRVASGAVLGVVQETPAIEHRILVPPGTSGTVTAVASGDMTVDAEIASIDGRPVTMVRSWPVRTRRPAAARLDPTAPLVTGMRVVDTLFPLARGGSATIPGGFGTGKTVHEQTLAKWSDADIIVYIGCGERGNELAEVLEEFPALVDPRSGRTLMDRTILIANTSNMPVAAREASIYTGITIAEYYRDQGYDVALLADSTSRWGEALREVSGRLEEMPGEEGYPAYLPSRLAEFYERSGAVLCLGGEEEDRRGSVSVVGAVSPPGGDFSEPVTQYSLRLAGTFWALEPDLARRRHYPAIHWTRSYTLYDLSSWFESEVAPDWEEQRAWALGILAQEEDLQSIVRLLGVDVLAPGERVVFLTGRFLREDFLQQSAFDEIDAFCPLHKQYHMLRVIRRVHETLREAAAGGGDLDRLSALPSLADVAGMRRWPAEAAAAEADALIRRVEREVAAS
jgi:V/A-type H+/Na+-transporting ATPase subunit A